MTDNRQRLLRYAFMNLARQLDSRFEKLLLSGRVAKWYSEVGNEATTVTGDLGMGGGDVLCTLYRDLGANLRVAYPDRPVPYARVLESALLPGVEEVLAAARKVLAT